MGFNEWMLALHVLATFAIASALVLFSVMVVVGRRLNTLEETRTLFRLAPVGAPLIGGGSVLALLLGIVLAIDSDQYQLWDGWIIAALVLWAAMAASGARTGRYYTDVQKLSDRDGSEADVLGRLRAPTGRNLHLANVALFLLLVIDMLFKPGA